MIDNLKAYFLPFNFSSMLVHFVGNGINYISPMIFTWGKFNIFPIKSFSISNELNEPVLENKD